MFCATVAEPVWRQEYKRLAECDELWLDMAVDRRAWTFHSSASDRNDL